MKEKRGGTGVRDRSGTGSQGWGQLTSATDGVQIENTCWLFWPDRWEQEMTTMHGGPIMAKWLW